MILMGRKWKTKSSMFIASEWTRARLWLEMKVINQCLDEGNDTLDNRGRTGSVRRASSRMPDDGKRVVT